MARALARVYAVRMVLSNSILLGMYIFILYILPYSDCIVNHCVHHKMHSFVVYAIGHTLLCVLCVCTVNSMP